MIVGAYGYDIPETDGGAAFVFIGSSGGLSTSYSIMADSDQSAENMGRSVASAGDVNGDGYSDLIIGDYNYDGT